MEKLLIVCCLLGILVKDAETVYILDKVPCVVDSLWKKVNDGWFVTTGSYMARFFTSYVSTPKNSLSLYERQFISGDRNFVDDFKECGMTTRFARAYYRSLNMYDTWYLKRLTIEDMDLVVDAIDYYTGNLGLGFVTASQFKKGLTDRVFRSLPLSMLYKDTMDDSTQIFKGSMNINTFVAIHKEMDKDGDGNVTRAEMGQYWGNKDIYDRPKNGKKLFDKLDYQRLRYINVTHWEAVFDDLNCVSSPTAKPEDKITHKEFIQLDLILHGDRPYPLDKRCIYDELIKYETT